jgi:hypothetical protein
MKFDVSSLSEHYSSVICNRCSRFDSNPEMGVFEMEVCIYS